MVETRKVILGVTASDPHVVANHLIAHTLRKEGFKVINLGACTPIEDFVYAFQQHPLAEAILIGSLNGHAYQDLKDLKDAKKNGLVTCPVIVGGNLSVGSVKENHQIQRLYSIGVDVILDSYKEIISTLNHFKDIKNRIAS